MADDGSEEKTLPPTAQRLRQLARDGQVPSSQTLATLAPLIVGVGMILFFGSYAYVLITELFGAIPYAYEDDFMSVLIAYQAQALYYFYIITVPLLAACSLAGIVVILADRKGVLGGFKSAGIGFDRLNPVTNVKNMFSLRTMLDLLRGFTTTIVMLVVLTFLGVLYMNDIFWSPTCGSYCMAGASYDIIVVIIGTAIAILILEALIDFPVSRILFKRDNKMSHSDLKRERKESFGSPEVRRERRRLQNEARQAPAVPRGVAPTLFIEGDEQAVMLYFKKGETPAPVLMKKYKGDAVQTAHSDAINANVATVYENEIAARLAKEAQVGGFIPKDSFMSVAGILVRKGLI